MVCWVDGGGDDGASEMLRIPPQLAWNAIQNICVETESWLLSRTVPKGRMRMRIR